MLWTLLVCSAAWGGDWFIGPIRYWDDDGVPDEAVEAEDETPEDEVGETFDWSRFEDPANPAFWDDGGDYVPPAPMLELARHPTPENAERVRAWLKRKLEVSARVADLLAEPPAPVNWRDVDIVYFYASSCPHCRRNAPILFGLKQRGARVLPVHLDTPSSAFPRSVPFTADMARALPVTGTPTFVVVVGGRRTVVRGFSSVERLERAVRQMTASGGASRG